MIRNGSVVLLGAGASADAGYPVAGQLHERFFAAVDEEAAADEHLRTIAIESIERLRDEAGQDGEAFIVSPFDEDRSNDLPTITEQLVMLWERYTMSLQGLLRLGRSDPRSGSAVTESRAGLVFASWGPPTLSPDHEANPSLEGFFSFLERTLSPDVPPVDGVAPDLRVIRRLRQTAIRVAYEQLGPSGHAPLTYLTSLLALAAPVGQSATIVTLNFDLSVEQLLRTQGIAYQDGFADEGEVPSMAGSPVTRLGEEAAGRAATFVGFAHSSTALRLLKPHGSLNWFTLEEGNGEIGWPALLRDNSYYTTFRVDPELFEDPGYSEWVRDAALGGPRDPILPSGTTRKAGAIWIRPHLEFVRSVKFRPTPISIELMAEVVRAVSGCRSIVVVGYSWNDAHINDLVLGTAARGASIVNVGFDSDTAPLEALVSNRLPTTHESVLGRIFHLGGGAADVLAGGARSLPSEVESFGEFVSRLDPAWSIGGR